MSRLTVYAGDAPGPPLLDTTDGAAIADALAAIGVRFERWATRPLAAGADDAAVLAAYAGEIARLREEGGYTTVDVARIAPDHPERAAMRGKFLAEHRHADDEVRFFVEGAGLFCLRDSGRVFALLAQAGDLVRVPAGTRHWFDMGAAPSFTAIRLFRDPAGWVADFTGDTVAERFPGFAPA